MKIPAFNPLLSALLALHLALIPSLRAQDAPAAPPPESPAAAPAPAATEALPAVESDKTELRRLDVPATETASEPSKEPTTEVVLPSDSEKPAAVSANDDDKSGANAGST